ncbi:hypothetical protein MAPG_07095 [Magnaporthiopsis poae ATCC 64411]|uniref:PhoD-like phosphatase domain-containing protein n=1 Tax=Magnaporthiopsis poae (strain ATCC 64411 / 73-15) TaxID=644358 RepID=A0A0C4E3S6_MAGP6|nr:hypothetical protein MAPG_07095 [Magnaporthiopsis poae ATCC 64411]
MSSQSQTSQSQSQPRPAPAPAPYWGALPGPKLPGQQPADPPPSHSRRVSPRARRHSARAASTRGWIPREFFRQHTGRTPEPGRQLTPRGVDPSVAYQRPVVRIDTNGTGTGTAQPAAAARKKFANDRSPLQRLELTLDSITKEEKRARVAAAEERARRRALGAAAEVSRDTEPPTPASSERQRNVTDPAGAQPRRQPPLPPPPLPREASPSHPGPLTQNPPDDGKRYSSAPAKNPVVADLTSDAKTAGPASANSSGIPQRNLSFRERTAKRAGLSLPEPGVSSPVAPLGRNVSNKLRKPPPPDMRPPRNDVPPPAPAPASAPAPIPPEPSYPPPAPNVRNGPPRFEHDPAPDGPHVRTNTPPTPPDSSLPVACGPPADQRSPSFSPGGRTPAVGPRGAPPVGLAPAAEVTRAPIPRKKVPEAVDAPPYPPQGQYMSPASSGKSNNGQRDFSVGAAAGAAALAGAGGMHAADAARTGSGPVERRVQYEDGDYDDRDYDDDAESVSSGHGHHFSNLIFNTRQRFAPGKGLFKPTEYLDEWSKATIGTLSGSLLDLTEAPQELIADKGQAWWETPPKKRRGSSSASRPIKAEAFDGEYTQTNAPTRFKPPLYLECGPLLRYCGIRTERVPSRSAKGAAAAAMPDREIWRGSVMIVTRDDDSSYEIAPTLRLFAQPIELLPPPPAELPGGQVLAPEYVDPIAGHPVLGRKGETLYVRPIDHLEEAKDLSRIETDEGLFEKVRSPPDEPGVTELPGSFASRLQRTQKDGEKLDKHKDVRGFRLHAERGLTFWRFNIEVQLLDKQQRIAYRINRGPSTGFWVPARGEAMNVMFHSCNGFSLSVTPDEFSGPDPMWRDVLNTHQTRPFHVMIGGGDQIYNDIVMHQTTIFREWLAIRNPVHKHNAPFTTELQDELETFYLERYCMWFSQGLFGMANSQIPMVNMYDDHDIIDGFGSYPHHFMTSPVFSGLGNVAFKYYMLFQHQSVPAETEASEPSWSLGLHPGPYIAERSRSLFMSLGGGLALLAVDCRTERTRDEVMTANSWQKLMDRCYDEVIKGKTKHLLVLLGVPIAYPRLVWLENILTSRLFEPVKALAKMGMMGGLLNKFDGGVEVLDDLDDHWTAKHHKMERKVVIEDLQDLAVDRSVRITLLSGDVHLAAVGQFYSNPKLGMPKHRDFRYMPNVISSAIVNTPPPDMLADVLNKRNKVHVFDNGAGEKRETFEDMIPIFGHGVDGKPRNNKRLLPHRNWCSIRLYVPGSTPPSTPGGGSAFDQTSVNTVTKGGIMRRLSKKRGPSYQPDVSRPPLSGGSGLFRTFSRRGRASADDVGPASQRPGVGRTMSLNRGDFSGGRPASATGGGGGGGIGGLFRRLSGRGRRQERPLQSPDAKGKGPEDGRGVNGNWGDYESEGEGEYYQDDVPPAAARRLGLRGGSGGRAMGNGQFNHSYDEFAEGDESYFTARAAPLPPQGMGSSSGSGRADHSYGGYGYGPNDSEDDEDDDDRRYPPPHPQPGPGGHPDYFRPKPLHRAPTNMTTRQMRRGGAYLDVNLEDALEVTLNVEVNPKDPAGITVPYRLVVPRLWYDYTDDSEVPGEQRQYQSPPPQQQEEQEQEPTGIKRLLSLRRNKSDAGPPPSRYHHQQQPPVI